MQQISANNSFFMRLQRLILIVYHFETDFAQKINARVNKYYLLLVGSNE